MKVGNKVYCKRGNCGNFKGNYYSVKTVEVDNNNIFLFITNAWYLYKCDDYLLDIDEFYMFDDYFYTLKYMRRLKLDIIKYK